MQIVLVRHGLPERLDVVVGTADPPLAGLGRRQAQAVAEYDAGRQSYVPVHQLRETHAEMWQQMLRGDLPDYVDLAAFRARVTDALEEVMAAHPGRGRVAVFCHAGVINVALGGYLGISRALPFPVDYTGVSRITASRAGRRAVISVNETAHVRMLLDVDGAPG